jgi:hypothetical protein
MCVFTPVESPSIYAAEGGNRNHQLLIEGGVKALSFLTGFTLSIMKRKEFERSERNHSYRIPFNESFPFLNKLFKINVCGEGLIRAGVYKIYMTKSMRIEEEHQSPLKVDKNIQKKKTK